MKKLILFLTLSMSAVFTMESCHKEHDETVVQKSMSAILKVNESHTFTLPANKSKDAYRVTTQPAHSIVSLLGTSADGIPTYQYTPIDGYIGIDRAVISTNEESHEGHKEHKGGGNCGDKTRENKDEGTVVTIDITVQNTVK
jgi:hypothetical protein